MSSRSPLGRRIVAAAAGLAVIAAGAAALLSIRTEPSEPVALAEPEGPYAIGAAGDNAEVLVFGDSWTYGTAASERENGYAYRLAGLGGWHVTVAGEPASGYLREGVWGRTFGERIEALDPSIDPDLVVLQGSINDRILPARGYRDAVEDAWDAMAEKFPDAEVLVLGPAPQVLPVEKTTARIDRDLSALADERGWPYVSPVTEKWITPANYAETIDTSATGKDHPSDAGHRYLAEQVAAAVRPLLEPVPVEAGTELPEPAVGD